MSLPKGWEKYLTFTRALMLQPILLMIDESSLGLSAYYMEDVFDKIKEINEQGTSILLVEQNARMTLEYSDRAYVIGEINFKGASNNLLKNDEIKKSFL